MTLAAGASPRLKMIAATAPAAWALATLAPKVQVPRCISATAPSTASGKSAASQPLVDVAFGVALVSTGTTAVSVTVPVAE